MDAETFGIVLICWHALKRQNDFTIFDTTDAESPSDRPIAGILFKAGLF